MWANAQRIREGILFTITLHDPWPVYKCALNIRDSEDLVRFAYFLTCGYSEKFSTYLYVGLVMVLVAVHLL